MRLQIESRFGPQHQRLLPFRPPGGQHRKPVAGGRWKVRRYAVRHPRPWRAWTDGKVMHGFSRRFATQAEAVTYGRAMALIVERVGIHRAIDCCRTYRAGTHQRPLEQWPTVDDVIRLHVAAEQ